MGVVIDMEYAKAIPPKTEAGMHMGQRFILRYDPHAPPDARWVWVVRFTRTYTFEGSAATLEAATKAAKRQIKELVGRD